MRFNLVVSTLFLVLTFTTNNYLVDSVVLSKTLAVPTFIFLETIFSYLTTLLSNFIITISFKTLTSNALIFTFKFVLTIALLVFIRGGVPRYRYDFLTKIG